MNDTAQRAVELLLSQKKKVGLAESCTGGLVAKLITDVPGSSSVFDCGIVSYSNEIKQKLLCVPEELLKTCGAVSAEVAQAMAEGVRTVSGSDIGVGITGIAGPSGATPRYPVGTSFICVTDGETADVRRIQTGEDGENCRDYNRGYNARCALNMVIERLGGDFHEKE